MGESILNTNSGGVGESILNTNSGGVPDQVYRILHTEFID